MDIFLIAISCALFITVLILLVIILKKSRSKIDNSETNKLEVKLNNAKFELDKLRNEKKDQEDNFVKLSSLVDNLETIDKKNELISLNNEMKKTNEKIKIYEEQILLLESKNNECNTQIELLQKEVNSIPDKVHDYENIIINYKDEIKNSEKLINDYKSKIEYLEKDISKLKSKLQEYEVKISTNEAELINLRDNNSKNLSKIQVLEKKDLESKEVLDVIRKISSAPDVDNTNKLSKVRDEVKNLVDNVIKQIDKMDIVPNEYDLFKEIEDNFFKWKDIEEKPWLKNKKTIAIMGKFSSGKSSLINTLIGGDILGTDVRPTTAVPTYITNDIENSKDIKFLNPHGKIKRIDDSSFSILSNQQKIENIPLRDLCKYFIISSDKDFFRNTSILDTPGYDADKNSDLEASIETIKESDIVFWTIDINEGEMKNDALEFIKKYLSEKYLIFILNKIDSKSPSEREEVKEKVISTLKSNSIKYKDVMLFSSKKNKENVFREEFVKYKDDLILKIKKVDYCSNKVELDTFIMEKFDMIKQEISQKIINSNNIISKNEQEILKEQRTIKELQDGIEAKYKDIDNFILDPNRMKDKMWGGKKIDKEDLPEFKRRIAFAKKTSNDNISEMEKSITFIGQYKKENLIEDDKTKKYREYIIEIGSLKGQFKNIYGKLSQKEKI